VGEGLLHRSPVTRSVTGDVSGVPLRLKLVESENAL
jgi:hypothetical protein